jgi:hypothetical protein
MTGEHPGIVQGDDRGNRPGERLESSEIEIAEEAVQVVQMHHVRRFRPEPEESLRAWEVKVLNTAKVVHDLLWRCYERGGPTCTARIRSHSVVKTPPEPSPSTGSGCVRDREDVCLAAALDSDGHPGLVTSSPVLLEELAGNLGGSTRIIDGADLKDSQCGLETTRGGSGDPSHWYEH